MKLGTWVNPWRVARSAPMISMLRSRVLRMSLMWRLSEYSIWDHYTGRRNRYPLLIPGIGAKFHGPRKLNEFVKMSRPVGTCRDGARPGTVGKSGLHLKSAFGAELLLGRSGRELWRGRVTPRHRF